MSWLKVDDQCAVHPRVLALSRQDIADERLVNEAWGWTVRCAAASAAHWTDGHITEATAAQLGGARTPTLVKAARSAGLLGRRVRHPDHGPGWQLLLDVDDLLHIVSKADADFERRYRNALRNPDEYLPVRARDGDACRYCARIVNWKDRRSGRQGTLDHVDPDRDDLVVACKTCNTRKGKRTPEQADMSLLPIPTHPHYSPHTLELLERYGVTRTTSQPAGQRDPLATSPPAGQRSRRQATGNQPAPAPPSTPPGAAAEAIPCPTAPAATAPAAPDVTQPNVPLEQQQSEKPGTAARSSPDLARAAASEVPDLVGSGRDGPGLVGTGVPDPNLRSRDGPRRARRSRRPAQPNP